MDVSLFYFAFWGIIFVVITIIVGDSLYGTKNTVKNSPGEIRLCSWCGSKYIYKAEHNTKNNCPCCGGI